MSDIDEYELREEAELYEMMLEDRLADAIAAERQRCIAIIEALIVKGITSASEIRAAIEAEGNEE